MEALVLECVTNQYRVRTQAMQKLRMDVWEQTPLPQTHRNRASVSTIPPQEQTAACMYPTSSYLALKLQWVIHKQYTTINRVLEAMAASRT